MSNSNGNRGEIQPHNFYSLAAIADFLGWNERFIREKLVKPQIIRAIKVGRKYSVKGAWLIDGLSYYEGDIDDE